MPSLLSPHSSWNRRLLPATRTCLLVVLGFAPLLRGDTALQRATRLHEQARAEYQKASSSASLAWPLARACFDRAEALTSKPVRIALAKEGIEACRRALKDSPADAACHYYLALNLGILAQEQPLRALGWVRDMESHWQSCRLLDPGFDHAGADRSLGMLYAQCPPSPLGVGSRSKARSHLSRAVESAPEYPENRLLWIGFLLDRGEQEAAAEAFRSLEARLPEARTRFKCETWDSSWTQWDRQIEAFRAKLATRS
jgi:tetratricopeptide (TPR) repeat protein